MILVPIAGLSCGTKIIFFFFFPCCLCLLFSFLPFCGLEVAGGGVVSRVDNIGYSMESGSSWFEPLPDLRMEFVYEEKY